MKIRNPTSDIRNPPTLTGYVLAGGLSARMGSDKALLEFGGVTLLESAVARLREVCGEVRVVIGAGREAYEGYRIVRDVFGGRGAPGGVHAALADCPTECAMVVAVDLPFVGPEHLRGLIDAFFADGEQFDCVVPVDSGGRWQPLCAVYRAETCRRVLESLLTDSQPSMRHVIEGLNAKLVDAAIIAKNPEWLLNVNTPEEFAAAKGNHSD